MVFNPHTYRNNKDGIGAPGDAVAANSTDDNSLVSLAKKLVALLSGTVTVSLPAGGATAANQTTGNASLTTIASITKAEDVASANADVGVPAMAVRKAAPANTSGTDGDYEMLQMSGGRLWASAAIDTALPAGTNNIGTVSIKDISSGEYETVAASQTAQVIGATGATGDYISGLLVVPASTSPGNVLLLDNATSITVFAGGASSVSNLVPFYIPLGMISVSGAWKVTTGASVSVIAIGNFT